MKTESTTKCATNKKKSAIQLIRNNLKTMNVLPVCLTLILAVTISTGCRKTSPAETISCTPATYQADVSEAMLNNDASIQPQTAKELIQARTASAKYRNIDNAIADGYADIDVIKPNMGFHYMKSTL